MPPRRVDAEEPGSNGAPGDPDELLAQAGAAKEHLPQDMQVKPSGQLVAMRMPMLTFALASY